MNNKKGVPDMRIPTKSVSPVIIFTIALIFGTHAIADEHETNL
jgi:hypothetical protein